MKAAHDYLEARYDSPGEAAEKYGVERQHVNYYVRKLVAQGVERSETSERTPSSTASVPAAATQLANVASDPYVVYCEAWAFAAEQMQHHGRRAAARLTREKYHISFSASSAARAAKAGGVAPGKRGAALSIPEDVERKLEDLCLLLRELNLPIYRFMILNYVNMLVAGTDVAESLKDKEVKRGWYYRWLSRCTRLKTANLTPLEMTRAQWATSANAKTHYDMLSDLLLKLNLAVQNPEFEPEKPYSIRLHIYSTSPSRIESLAWTRVVSQTTRQRRTNRRQTDRSSARARAVGARSSQTRVAVTAQE